MPNTRIFAFPIVVEDINIGPAKIEGAVSGTFLSLSDKLEDIVSIKDWLAGATVAA